MASNYNAVTIDVDPWPVNSAATAVNNSSKDIADALGTIQNTLQGLKLSWVGTSQQTADAFTARWNDMATKLYGTQADPSTGILNVLSGGLGAAAVNYSQTEETVKTLFDTFYNNLVNPASGAMQTHSGSLNTGTGTVTWSYQTPGDAVDQPTLVPGTNSGIHTTSVNETYT